MCRYFVAVLSQYLYVRPGFRVLGPSTSQPTGIFNTSGIGSVPGCTNGLTPTLYHIIDLKKAVSVEKADTGNAPYVTNAKVEAVLSKLKDGYSAYHL